MAYFHSVVFLALLLVAPFAQATTMYRINNVAVTNTYTTAAAACNMTDVQTAATQESTPPSHVYTVTSVSYVSPATCSEVYTDTKNGVDYPGITGSEGIISVTVSCTAGDSFSFSKPMEWVPVGSASYLAPPTSFCVSVGGVGCNVPMNTGGYSGLGFGSGAPVNGSVLWMYQSGGVTDGATCTYVAPSASPAPPACAGSAGMINGVSVCIPTESAADKAARAASAAAMAAQAATAAAKAGGASDAVAAAAGAAAGAAASAYVYGGGGGGAAAAASAGAAAGASTAGGGTGAAGAGVGAAAGAGTAAAAAAAAAGKDSAAQSAASMAASAAAGAAAANGASAGDAAAAGAAGAAGQNGRDGTNGSNAASPAGPGAPGAPGAPGPAAPNPVDDFCKNNPTASICKKAFDSTFSGSCGSAPACSGDAVQCAVAAATFKTECDLSAPTPESAVYDTAKTATGDQTNSLPGNRTFLVSSSSFSSTELLGAATGMTDRTVTVMGTAVTLPFSSVNVWLARLGALFMAVTFLLCIRIVTRG